MLQAWSREQVTLLLRHLEAF